MEMLQTRVLFSIGLQQVDAPGPALREETWPNEGGFKDSFTEKARYIHCWAQQHGYRIHGDVIFTLSV